ncbi:L,D-transpeptidase [Nocardioides sp. TRM66260-LWL]|uniref:L,D-transpeptidase n=1 Tax=Nocardioides sp. TRM66260-LWL TaxID=2874478 RepID=UPI001CC470D5|nr:L,D-transpeptidase [Nocardioides sp. TRM66260-LWL]MBZ5734180.1 L,D-transpeptidase [Nocardioides sp. TRM66260-LWL]
MGGRHARTVRPRYGRIALLAGSVVTTLVAVLGGVGVLPTGADEPAYAAPAAPPTSAAPTAVGSPAVDLAAVRALVPSPARLRALPAASGSGRRVVFSQGRQRVWLVDRDDRVRSTYLVSGSVTDNLRPGRYAVWSRSMRAVGIEDSGTMRLFVRFARGPSGAAIGFHTIPVDDGRPVQSVAALGTPRSHGCIRQRTADAERLWRFAPLGTRVVVVA